MTENIFTPNELIYLLLDGEASPVQRDQVFQALAHDPDLQHEFDSALKLNNAFEQELKSSKPSAALMGSLFQKAGMTTLGIGGGAVVSTALKTGWIAGLSKIFVPVAAALLGSAVTYSIVSSGNNSAPSHTEQTQAVAQHQTENIATNIGTSIPQSPAANTMESVQRVKYIVVHDTIRQENDMVNDKAISTQVEHSNTVTPDAAVIPTDDKNVSKAEPREETPKAIQTTDADNHSLQTLTTQREPKKVFVTLRGNTALRVFPNRDITSSQNNPFSNLSGGLLYEFAPNMSAGIEVGQETFPINVINANGTVEKRFNLLWGGLAVRYMFDPIEMIGGLQPFAHLVAAGTVSGPMGKLALGMAWQPDNSVILSLGLEGMMQTYQYHNTWGHGEKLGITSGIAIRF